MFSRVATLFTVLFFVMFAAASAVPRTNNPPPPPPPPPSPSPSPSPPTQNCNTGSIQCCNSVQSANSPAVGLLAGLLGIVLGPVQGLIGLTCSPLSVVGVGGNSCNSQTVCCTGNNFSGLLVLGCSPININL